MCTISTLDTWVNMHKRRVSPGKNLLLLSINLKEEIKESAEISSVNIKKDFNLYVRTLF